MKNTVKTACIQMNGGPDIAANIVAVSKLIREAAAKGARFIATPETTDLMCYPRKNRLLLAQSQEDSDMLKAMQDLAKELQITLLVGSISIKLKNRTLANRSFLLSRAGEIIATYDKIHLFDVDLPNGERFKESATIAPGNEAVVAQTDDFKLGMSICYDIRFPHLYRDMAKAGAQILSVPAAFSMPTGEAHWKTLLRARAIETGSFVIAPGQTGIHEEENQSWGHSIIIAPWGEVLAEMGSEVGIITADLDLSEVEKARAAIPALKHDRDYTLKS